MKLLSLILLLHVTKVKLYAISYHQQNPAYRNGWWGKPYWWRRSYQPAHHSARSPMVVTPYVITVTEQQASIPISTSTDKLIGSGILTASSISTTTSPPTTQRAETTSVASVTTVNDSVATATTSFNIQGNLTGSFTNQTDILLKCEKLRPKALRDACVRVAKNPILAGEEGVRGYVGDEELGSFITTRGLFGQQVSPDKDEFCEAPYTCPKLDINKLPSKRNLRSTSPWVSCQEYDPNRFPQWLKTVKCLCDGCIDLRTGSQNGGSVVSQLLTVDVSVIRKLAIGKKFTECNSRICREEIQSIGVGCHCALPDIRISSHSSP